VVMARYLHMLHPYMPHITEELSLRMGYIEEGVFLMQKELSVDPLLGGIEVQIVQDAQAIADAVYESAGKLRNLKAEYRLAARKDVRFIAKSGPAWLEDEATILTLLVGAESVSRDASYAPEQGTPGALTAAGEIFMPLDGFIDVDAEKARLGKEIEKVEIEVRKCQGKLSNERFVANAKPEVVAIERERLAEWEGKLAQLSEMRANLG
jgi:valyl-tRNA synthetase